MREQRDRFDDALDEALASYGEAPESAGLERRILARVAERTARRPSLRPFAVAICTAAAVCCLVWWKIPKAAVQTHPAKTTVSAVRKIETSKIQIPAHGQAIVLVSATKPRRTLKTSAEPKLSQFPTPFPMSSEERALVRLAMRDAKDIPPELTQLGGPIKPIQIAAVEIKPLQ
jgi:hypothetical protein